MMTGVMTKYLFTYPFLRRETPVVNRFRSKRFWRIQVNGMRQRNCQRQRHV